MKKLISVILTLIIAATSLCACGGSKQEAAYTPVDTDTVAVGAVVIARDDVAEDDVYNFVSTVFESKDEITASHAKGAELDLDFAASVTSVPYHPGAARYFREKGLEVPTK